MEIQNLTFNTLSSKQLGHCSGVYKISLNEHVYIGSSKNLYSRLYEHRTDLFYRRHSNEFLQKVCNKYGIENFVIDIIEFCEPDIRIQREKYWIDFYKSDMNLQDPISHTLSESSKQKLSKSVQKGLKEGKYKKKYDFATIECYDYFGNFIREFSSKEEAATGCNISTKDVQTCLSGYKKGTSVKGYRFRYSCSKVPIQSFDNIRPHEVGRYFDFYYIDENGNQVKAFSSVKDCWTFFTQHCKDKQIIIQPKLKSRESGNTRTDDAEGNPNPSILEIE